MNSNLAFADAARPARAVVFRLLLLPYSIGHELLLTAEGNPLVGPWPHFLKLTGKQQCHAVMRAAQICCRTWSENQTQPLSRWFLARWKFYNRHADYALEIAGFRNYREAGATFPAIGAPESDGRLLGSPFMARLLAFHGVNNMDMPLGMAQWIYFAHAENEGMCKVLNEHEAAVQNDVEKLKSEGLPEDEKARIETLMKQAMETRCHR